MIHIALFYDYFSFVHDNCSVETGSNRDALLLELCCLVLDLETKLIYKKAERKNRKNLVLQQHLLHSHRSFRFRQCKASC